MEYRDIAWTVYQNLPKFFESRKITPQVPRISVDDFNKIMRTVSYVTVEGVAAKRERLPERKSIIIIFSPSSEAAKKKGNFTKLIDHLISSLKDNPAFTKDIGSALNNTDLIFISSEKPVTVISGYEEILYKLKSEYEQLNVEAYTYEKLFITPDNSIIPKHRILSQEEVEMLNTDRLTDNSKRTAISIQDLPIVWLGARIGDTIEIDRPSGETGKSCTYRVVR